MKNTNVREVYLLAALLGVLISFIYINPYNGTISLSSVVFHLSGRRGNLILNPNLSELLSLCTRTLPYLFGCAFLGTSLYRSYSTATVVVFSRITDRTKWFIRECAELFAGVSAFNAVLMFSEIITAVLRFEVTVDETAVPVILIHYALYTLWFFGFVLFSNTVSVFLTGEGGYSIAVIVHSVCVAALSLAKNRKLFPVIKYNPMANLVLDWHTAASGPLSGVFVNEDYGMSVTWSFIFIAAIDAAMVIAGILIINRRDLLTDDLGQGGI